MSDPVSRCKAAGIPADRVEEYKAAWTLFSPDLNSTLSSDALGRLLNDTFGCAYTPDDLDYMLKQFGDGGRVDFVSFASSLHAKLSDSRYNEAFGDAFDLLDTNKTGELTKEELQSGMLKLGETLTDAEAEEMLKIARKKDDWVKSMTTALASTQAGSTAPASSGPTQGAAAPSTPAATPTSGPGPSGPAGRPSGPRPSPSAGGPGGPGAPRAPGVPGGPAGGPGAPAAPRAPGGPGAPSAPRAPGGPSAPRAPRAPGT